MNQPSGHDEGGVPGRREHSPGPLTGLRVLELGDEKVEYCGLVLAGLGAEVIKIEPPDGSPSRRIGPFTGEGKQHSIHFWTYNRAKQSIISDLEGDRGIDGSLGELLSSSDVLLESVPRDKLLRYGLSTVQLEQRFPTLIHARMTPFGDTGPWADYHSSDLVSLALGGVVMNCGYDPEPSGRYDLPPVAPQAWQSLHIAGEQLAMAVVAALVSRAESGAGQSVSVAIHEAVAKNTEIDLMSWIMNRQPIYRQTCRHAAPVATAPSLAYTKDGRWMLAMSVGKRDRRALGPFLARYGLGADVPEVVGEDEVGVRAVAGSTDDSTGTIEFVQRLTRRFTYENLPWRDAQQAGQFWSPVRKPHENAVDPHWISRGTFADIFHPEVGRSVRYPVSKWVSTRGSWKAGRPAPALGEHDISIVRARPRPPTPSGEGSFPRDHVSAHNRPFPLQGIRILDFGWFLASAGATRYLASLGAEVIKVEWKTHPDTGRGSLVPLGGRRARDEATEPLPDTHDARFGGQYNNKNPGKYGLSLNVADPRGLAIAKSLLKHCDVVTEGFSPGVLERWGLGYDVQRSIRPDIIYVKQSGMGAFGEYGRFRAVGPVAGALSGLSEMSGLPEPAPPAGWGYSFLDWFGANSMALAVLAAIYHRQQTGEGQWIDASQTEAGIGLTALAVVDWSVTGATWQRYGNRSPFTGAAPEGIYRCSGEDRWVAITCVADDEFTALSRVANRPEWLVDDRFSSQAARLANHDALDKEVTRWSANEDATEIMERLQIAGVAAGVCQTAADRVDTDPQLRHLNWLTELPASGIGTWPLAETPVRMSRTPPHLGGLPRRGAPLYGEDNADILTRLLGMPEDEIRLLTEEGVL